MCTGELSELTDEVGRAGRLSKSEAGPLGVGWLDCDNLLETFQTSSYRDLLGLQRQSLCQSNFASHLKNSMCIQYLASVVSLCNLKSDLSFILTHSHLSPLSNGAFLAAFLHFTNGHSPVILNHLQDAHYPDDLAQSLLLRPFLYSPSHPSLS